MESVTAISTRLKEEFDYHSDGYLIRKSTGRRAGTKMTAGYRVVGFEKKRYTEHKLIFAYHHGFIPDVTDHIDWDKTNNRIENLREATKSLNEANTGVRRNNSSGYKGVAFHKAANKWRAYLQCKHIGLFETAEEAAKAYNQKAYEVYGEYAYLNDIKE